jgi:hypothetical protein
MVKARFKTTPWQLAVAVIKFSAREQRMEIKILEKSMKHLQTLAVIFAGFLE